MIKTKDLERKELLISISIIFLSLVLFYLFVFRPRIKDISGTKQVLERVQDRLGKASRAIPEVGKYENENTLLELEKVSLKTKIPSEQQIPRLLDKLRRMAKEAGIEDVSLSTKDEQIVLFKNGWTPGITPDNVSPPAPSPADSSPSPGKTPQGKNVSVDNTGNGENSFSPSQECYRIPVTIRADGKYRSLAKFLAAIPNSDRLFTITSLRLQREEELIPLIRAEIKINAFYLRPHGQDKKENLRR